MTKKVLACLLAVMLALSLLPGTAGAVKIEPGGELNHCKAEANEGGTIWLMTEVSIQGNTDFFYNMIPLYPDMPVASRFLVNGRPIYGYNGAVSRYTYDDNGNLLSVEVKGDDELSDSTLTFTYDQNGNPIAISEVYETGSSSTSVVWNTDGKIESAKYNQESPLYSNEATYTFTYSNGLLLGISATGTGHDLGNVYTLSYTDNKDGTASVSADSTLTYDSNGNITSWTQETTRETQIFNETYNYTYDANNNLLSMEYNRNDSENSYKSTTVYSYTYDENGNVSKCAINYNDGENQGTTVLTMKYEPLKTGSNPETPTYNVTFDPNGGSPEPEAQTVAENGYAKEPTAPSKRGYDFVGWYWKDELNDAYKVSFDTYVVTGDTTLYAQWTETQSSGSSGSGGGATSYAVSTPSKTDNGSVTVSPKNAAQGKTVTITPKPDEGCKVDKVTVTDKNGSPVEVKDNGDGTYSFTMPGSKVNVTAAFVKNEPAPADNERFTDVPKDAWYHDAVYWAADNGITQGVDDTHFVPNGTCTRSEAVTFLWRAKGEPEPTTTTNPFKDVKESDYFYKAVLWAVENGITVGVKADAFAPKQTCSTAHILTFLYRTMGVGADGWYEDAGAWAEKDGLLKDTGLTANPKVNCPRGAVVTFLYREQK